MFEAKTLSSAEIGVLGQLFTGGPVWDGNVCSKSGRGELIKAGFAFREDGWTSLTPEGAQLAVNWDRVDLATRHDKRWINKLRKL